MSGTNNLSLEDFRTWVFSLKREELLDAMAFCFQSNSGSSSSSSHHQSHEYDLLLEMSRLQAPPSTPIHNKAMGYSPCSRKGARLEYAFREEERLRWTQPRVFRFRVDEESTLRRNNTTNRRGGPRNGATILKQHQQQHRRYKIKASKLVTISPWGEYYGLGSTLEQQQADEEIVRGTHLRRINTAPSSSRRQESSACFLPKDNNNLPTAKHILRMLHVTSRGNFLQTTPRNDDLFCTRWLEPIRSWFTLSKYLASRYEMALWESYRRFKRPEASLGPLIRSTKIWGSSGAVVPQNVIQRAFMLGLQDTLRLEQAQSRVDDIRDGILWPLLNRFLNHDPGILPCKCKPKPTLEAITHLSLTQVDCPYSNTFLAVVLSKLEVCWVEEQELTSIKVGKELSSVSNGGVVGKYGENDKGHKTKRNKKKKRKGKSKHARSVVPLPAIPADSEGELDDEDDMEIELQHRSTRDMVVPSAIDFPDNGTSAWDRNRNVITVLGILEDVLEDAFEKVGLPRTPAFADQREIDERERERKLVITPVSTHSTSKSDGSQTSKTKGTEEKKQGGSHDGKNTSGNAKSSTQQGTNGIIGKPLSIDVEATEYRNRQSYAQWGVPLSTGYQPQIHQYQTGPYAFSPFVGSDTQYSSEDALMISGVQDPFAIGRSLMLGETSSGIGLEGIDDWPLLNRYQPRDESIFSDFFSSHDNEEDGVEDDDELMAASTAASIASSTYKDTTLIADSEGLEDIVDETERSQTSEVTEGATIDYKDIPPEIPEEEEEEVKSKSSTSESQNDADACGNLSEKIGTPMSEASADSKMSAPDCRSPSPEAPVTPPPTLSPILLSLADLKDLQQNKAPTPYRHKRSLSTQIPALPGHGSLPSSPVPPPKNGLTTSWSRDDLRIQAFRDDQRIKPNRRQLTFQPTHASETPTYKAVAVKSLARPIASTRGTNIDFRAHVMESSLRKQNSNRETCARSETALDGEREDHQVWHHEDADSPSLAKDEVTTIASLASQRVEPEEFNAIREERNNFRDMCLTLGAEVARLKAMLAAQQPSPVAPPMEYQSGHAHPMVYRPGSFDPNGMKPFFRGMNSLRPGPMSDAGFHRGEHESQVSEDEVYEAVARSRESRGDVVRRMSSSHTVAGSDASVDFNNSNTALSTGPITGAFPMYDSVHSHGLQSRLTRDILQFLGATNAQLRKLDGKRKIAVERFSRLTKTIWPRAQVKLYGSYMSGLCLPSSDLDFVVCLPAVHKKDLALAPGVLEGRNAINETSQKLLARELKGESWIDPRSIKLIDRTIVPVIKVSTKDTRARVIQLDISFDSPDHHGLEANQMVAAILDELPLIRPLILVLKQFLLDRGLLTSYTGGLSSYCLFLMLARYLQEQPPASGDPGSLLMGFLDFYGNFFDPRVTGISVMRRQYFARANHHAANGYQPPDQSRWTNPTRSHQRVVVNLPTQMSHRDFRRNNSFSETGSVDGSKQLQHHRFPPTPGSASSTSVGSGGGRVFVPRNPVPPRPEHHNTNTPNGDTAASYDHVRPYTFDPLFVEDPLSASNNVGRNAFRINQVQRAFSDAHRALLASLDWDIHPTSDGDYPLLKCLLQGEDVLYEL